jgi:hypothetical protein
VPQPPAVARFAVVALELGELAAPEAVIMRADALDD